jgi:hypothetical protein
MFLAFVIVTIPAIYIALKAVKIQNSNPAKAAAEWQAIRDMYSAIELKDELAAIESRKLAAEVKRKEALEGSQRSPEHKPVAELLVANFKV